MRKKIIIGIACVIILIAMYLWLFATMSSSHVVAKRAIENSQEVHALIGNAKLIVLVGVRQKLRPNWISCTSSTYMVIGDAGFSFVNINMSMGGDRRDWVPDELSLGWFGRSSASC